MMYRVTFRMDSHERRPMWHRTSTMSWDEANVLSKRLDDLTGYPADVEPENRPYVGDPVQQAVATRQIPARYRLVASVPPPKPASWLSTFIGKVRQKRRKR